MKNLTATVLLGAFLAVPATHLSANPERDDEGVLTDEQLELMESELEDVLDRVEEIREEDDMDERRNLLEEHREDMRNTLEEQRDRLDDNDNGWFDMN